MDRDKVLQQILERLSCIEEQLKSAGISAPSKGKVIKKPYCIIQMLYRQICSFLGKIADQLADNVSSLVGLREAVTLRRRWIKYTWAVLLCFGLLATGYYIYESTIEYLENPTATNVSSQVYSAGSYGFFGFFGIRGSSAPIRKVPSSRLRIFEDTRPHDFSGRRCAPTHAPIRFDSSLHCMTPQTWH